MKKKVYYITGFLSLVIVLSLALSLIFEGFSTWNGWNVISSISTLLGSLSLIAIAYQLFLQKKEFDQNQIEFLMGLDPKFQEAKQQYNFAWNVLRDYPIIPGKMERDEWRHVVSALNSCYQSAHFTYKLARLVDNNIIDAKSLYTLYFIEVVDDANYKIEYLWEWCGTGLGLAANYDTTELLRMCQQTRKLCKKLFELDKEHDGHSYDFMIEFFDKLEEDILKGNKSKEVQTEDGRVVEILDTSEK